ncbi:MAG: hypothetical protein HYV09_36190, partial [Deltaproteobacteria bacterium]|nr:hypothetical protein [Deltaproteobacteria bacterium]
MIDVAHIEMQAGGTAGIGTPITSRYVLWSAPTIGVAPEFRLGPSSRWGIGAWYQLNYYGEPGSSDYAVYNYERPRAHVPQLVLYYGYVFKSDDGSEHGPRVGIGALVAFEATDPVANNIPSSRVVYPGVFAQVSYHGAYALPGSRISLTGEVSLILGATNTGDGDWSLQTRAVPVHGLAHVYAANLDLTGIGCSLDVTSDGVVEPWSFATQAARMKSST